MQPHLPAPRLLSGRAGRTVRPHDPAAPAVSRQRAGVKLPVRGSGLLHRRPPLVAPSARNYADSQSYAALLTKVNKFLPDISYRHGRARSTPSASAYRSTDTVISRPGSGPARVPFLRSLSLKVRGPRTVGMSLKRASASPCPAADPVSGRGGPECRDQASYGVLASWRGPLSG